MSALYSTQGAVESRVTLDDSYLESLLFEVFSSLRKRRQVILGIVPYRMLRMLEN